MTYSESSKAVKESDTATQSMIMSRDKMLGVINSPTGITPK